MYFFVVFNITNIYLKAIGNKFDFTLREPCFQGFFLCPEGSMQGGGVPTASGLKYTAK